MRSARREVRGGRLAIVLICAALAGCRYEPPAYAFVDRSGRVRIALLPSQAANSFSEGLAAVRLDGKWGFVIPPKFGSVEDFSGGLAAASMDSAVFGFIDTKGEYVIPPRFQWASTFSEGLAAVCVDDCDSLNTRVDYIDRHGTFVLRTRMARGGRFSEGLACASYGALEGFIDKSGKFVIAPQFEWAGDFSDGLAATDEGLLIAADVWSSQNTLWVRLERVSRKAGPPSSEPRVSHSSIRKDLRRCCFSPKDWPLPAARLAVCPVAAKTGVISTRQGSL